MNAGMCVQMCVYAAVGRCGCMCGGGGYVCRCEHRCVYAVVHASVCEHKSVSLFMCHQRDSVRLNWKKEAQIEDISILLIMKNHLHVEHTFLDSSGSYKLTKQTSFSDTVKQIHTDICASSQKYIPFKKKISTV